jgi:hypothetical protein
MFVRKLFSAQYDTRQRATVLRKKPDTGRPLHAAAHEFRDGNSTMFGGQPSVPHPGKRSSSACYGNPFLAPAPHEENSGRKCRGNKGKRTQIDDHALAIEPRSRHDLSQRRGNRCAGTAERQGLEKCIKIINHRYSCTSESALWEVSRSNTSFSPLPPLPRSSMRALSICSAVPFGIMACGANHDY